MSAAPLLRAVGLCKSYRRRQVLRDVCFAVDGGEIVGLLGPNGAGKTTSFNIVAGLAVADAGEVCLGGRPLGRLPLYRRARLGLGYLPQEPTVFRGLSARDNLMAVAAAQPRRGAPLSQRVDALLEQFHLGRVATVQGSQLSGGERRRLEMARALLLEPRLLLLDEPFAGVDPLAVAEIRGFVQLLRQQGIGVLITDHNVREALPICDRAYLMAEGAVLFEGPPAQLVADPGARRAYLGDSFVL